MNMLPNKQKPLFLLITSLLGACSTSDVGLHSLDQVPMEMSELYEQKDKYYDRIVSVRGRLSMSPSAHPGNLFRLSDLSDPAVYPASDMSVEEENHIVAEMDRAIAKDRKRHGGERVRYPFLRLDPLASVYDLRGIATVTVPEIYGVEVSMTKVLRGLKYKCLVVTGYFMDASGEWHIPEAKYAGAIVPIAMKPCDGVE